MKKPVSGVHRGAAEQVRVRRALKALLAGSLALVVGPLSAGVSAVPKFAVDDSSFKCMQDMTAVRHFYVDNLLGHLQETVAVAQAGKNQPPMSAEDQEALKQLGEIVKALTGKTN